MTSCSRLVLLSPLLAAAATACTRPPSAPSVTAAAAGPATGSPRVAPPPAPIQTIEPGRAAPPFRVTAASGETVDSSSVIGKAPVVIVFFATWCPVCARQMPALRRALAAHGDRATVFGVSFDDEDTWPVAQDFLDRYELRATLVRASANRRFSLSYDPFGGFPLVVVIGRDGRVVELVSGAASDHAERLLGALSLADAG